MKSAMRVFRARSILNYIYLFYVINHPIFTQYFNMDSLGYGVLFFSIITVIVSLKSFSNIMLQKPYVFWFVWVIYALLNYYIRNITVEILSVSQLFMFIVVPFVCMLVAVIEVRANFKVFIRVCAFIFLFFTYSVPLIDPMVFMRKYYSDAVLLGNEYAIISCFSLVFICLLHKTHSINVVFFVLLAAATLYALSLTGTRKAFYAGFIIVSFYAFSATKAKTKATYLIALLLFIGVVVGYKFIISNTVLGQRMEYYEFQGENELPEGAPKVLKVFGDRAPHYYYGWEEFLKSPIFGVGPKQARIGWDVYIHSEYMVQFVDNGIIGFVLFILLYGWIFLRLVKHYKQDNSWTIVMLGVFLAICFMDLTTWSWDSPAFFLCLGMLSSYSPLYTLKK